MPVLLERTRATKDQLRAVYAYIRRQREKGKQALAESKAKEEEEKHRKREQEKKKETVEDVKKEIAKLEAKLEELKQKKHDLFSQFKKALNYEDEMRKQQELQAMKAAAASFHVFGVQGLPSGQAALTTSVYPQSALVENTSNSGEHNYNKTAHGHIIVVCVNEIQIKMISTYLYMQFVLEFLSSIHHHKSGTSQLKNIKNHFDLNFISTLPSDVSSVLVCE